MAEYGGFLAGEPTLFKIGEGDHFDVLTGSGMIHLINAGISIGYGIMWNTPSAGFQQAAFFPIILRYLAGYQ